MAFELKFADIGEGVFEGEIIRWLVKEGDRVENEQPLVEVSTEKVNIEITSPRGGVIRSLEKKEGEIVKVGEVLARIETAEVSEAEKAVEPGAEKGELMFAPTRPPQPARPATKERGEVLASPSVRRKARDAGVDLHDVPGTGPAGRVTEQDLDASLRARKEPAAPLVPTYPVPPALEERVPLRGTRRVIARTMRKSKDTVADFSYIDEVDMSALDELRRQAEPQAEKRGVKLTYLPLIIKCVIPALRTFPLLNSTLDDEREEIVVKRYYNIGIAVDTDEGLVVPVIKNADGKSVWELAAEIRNLAERARSGKLALEDVQGGTFTITSIGNIGGTMATPIIRWPEVAILGVMRSKLRPVVVEKDGKPEIAIRPTMFLSLSVDHRVVDGAMAARFTNLLIRYMESPELALMEE